MPRSCAVSAFVTAVVVTLTVAIIGAHTPKAPDSLSLSVPCGPASPGLRAAGGSEAIAMKAWAAAFESTEATANPEPESFAEALAGTPPAATLRVFPPLLNRPPPINS